MACTNTDWHILGYEPSEEYLLQALHGFSTLINRMTIVDIVPENYREWIDSASEDDPVNCGYSMCDKHGVYLSFAGCKLCNDQRVD